MSQVLSFQSQSVRISVEGEQIWFVAKDICAVLGIPWNGNTTLQSIRDDWQGVSKLHTPSGKQALIIISEPAVYKLAFRSNKPEADAFTNWVASEVLPSIRKTGKYEAAPQQLSLPAPEPLPGHDDAYLLMREDMENLVNKIGWLMGYMRFRGPRAVPLNQLDLGNSIRRSIGDCIAALYEAQSHLADANRLTLMIKL